MYDSLYAIQRMENYKQRLLSQAKTFYKTYMEKICEKIISFSGKEEDKNKWETIYRQMEKLLKE